MTELTIAQLNGLTDDEAAQVMASCCRWPGWGRALARRRPYDDVAHLCQRACDLLGGLPVTELTEILSLYPPLASAYAGSSQAAVWSRGEESGISAAPPEIRAAIVEDAERYRRQFGYPFLISALGLSGLDILQQLQKRLAHSPPDEIEVSRDQLKIKAVRRLCRLVAD